MDIFSTLLVLFLPTFLFIFFWAFVFFLLLAAFTLLLDACLSWADFRVMYEIEVFCFGKFVVYGVWRICMELSFFLFLFL